MIGEHLIGIFLASDGNGYPILQTQIGFYMLGCSFIKRLSEVDLKNYEIVDCEFFGLSIMETWTDGESIYVELENLKIILSGLLDIDSDGNSQLAIYFLEKEELNEEGKNFEDLPHIYKVRPTQ